MPQSMLYGRTTHWQAVPEIGFAFVPSHVGHPLSHPTPSIHIMDSQSLGSTTHAVPDIGSSVSPFAFLQRSSLSCDFLPHHCSPVSMLFGCKITRCSRHWELETAVGRVAGRTQCLTELCMCRARLACAARRADREDSWSESWSR